MATGRSLILSTIIILLATEVAGAAIMFRLLTRACQKPVTPPTGLISSGTSASWNSHTRGLSIHDVYWSNERENPAPYDHDHLESVRVTWPGCIVSTGSTTRGRYDRHKGAYWWEESDLNQWKYTATNRQPVHRILASHVMGCVCTFN